MGLLILKTHQKQPKLQLRYNSSMLKKPRHVSLIKILRTIFFFLYWFNTYVYRRVSFSAVEIIISKEEEIFSPKILMMETTISFFLSEGLAVWRQSRNQFKSVWAETVENYFARKLELLSIAQCGIWQIMDKAMFFEKGSLLI